MPRDREIYRTGARRLRLLRQRLGCSPAEFAGRLDLTTRAYLAYEQGKRTGHGWSRLVRRLFLECDPFVSFDWLFGMGEYAGRDHDRIPVGRFGKAVPVHLRLVDGPPPRLMVATEDPIDRAKAELDQCCPDCVRLMHKALTIMWAAS